VKVWTSDAVPVAPIREQRSSDGYDSTLALTADSPADDDIAKGRDNSELFST
jgi:hypothetical protein